jgi:hypothetical protein
MELAFGFLQEGLGQPEATGAGLELDDDARSEGGAGGLEGLDLLAAGGVAVEERAGGGVEGGGLAGLVGPEAKGPRRTVSRKRPT